MLDKTIYDAMMDLAGAASGAVRAALGRLATTAPPLQLPPLLQVRAGYAESPAWFLVQAAEFDPQPLTVPLLRVRDVYASERIVAALLELLAGDLYLERTDEGAFALAEAGHDFLQRRRLRLDTAAAELAPLLSKDVARLAAILGDLVQASLTSPTPPESWCVAHSRQRAPDATTAPLIQLIQTCDDLNAWRDDAHMAAWQPLEIVGYAWEAFAQVCDGAADSAEGIVALLTHRGYSRQEYDAALADLVARGWMCGPSDQGTYTVRPEGLAVRTEVERQTDAYFYAPWSALSDLEVTETCALIVRVTDQLTALGA